MIRQRLMMWCTVAAVLTPASVYAQHGKEAPHADVEVDVSAKHDEHAVAKPEKETHEPDETPKRRKARALTASKRTTSSKERSSRLSKSRRAKPSAEHEAEAEHVAKSESPAKHGTSDEHESTAHEPAAHEAPAKHSKTEKGAHDVKTDKGEHGARAVKVARAAAHEPEPKTHGAEKPDEHEAGKPGDHGVHGAASKSPKTTRAARASRASKKQPVDEHASTDAHASADPHATHDSHENEQVAKVVLTRPGASTHALEESMERINAKVEAIKASSPSPAPAKRAPAKRPAVKQVPARTKPVAPAHDASAHDTPIASAPPLATEPNVPRVRLQWRTVLDWPTDLRNELEIPARATAPRVALSSTAK